jgi:phosphoglucomutase
MEQNRLDIVNKWLLSPVIEEADKAAIREMQKDNLKQLEESFYTDLEFGTGGLRGIMGVGTNRMNKYTVGMATQGLANYLIQQFPGQQISVVIARDSRLNSEFFSTICAFVLSANGIKVWLFNDIRPTPELSFAVRELGCHSGIMITASHNPKEYNGYKVYWKDGGQLVAPHDENVILEVKKIATPEEVNFHSKRQLIETIPDDFDEKYFEKLKTISQNPEVISKFAGLKIVYSPLHGTGYKILPEALKRFGFHNIIDVYPQNIPDGNFPTVVSPNPEEKAGLELTIRKAIETDADLLMATDPDADRLGVGVRIRNEEYMLLNGNQTAAILTYYLLQSRYEKQTLDGRQMIVKTIVTTDLLADIANFYHVKCFDVLTGFKYIADLILKYEGKLEYVCGGEESYGFLAGDFIRDKDAVMAACLVAETAAWAASQNKTLSDILLDIAVQFGLYREGLVSITKKGIEGMQEINNMMEAFRSKVPQSMAGRKLVKVSDYKNKISRDILTGVVTDIDLPESNVIQYFLEDGSKITMRPSGTEPKIKFYFSVKGKLDHVDDYEKKCAELDFYIEKLKDELNNL